MPVQPPPPSPSFTGTATFSNPWVLMNPAVILRTSNTGAAWTAIYTIAGTCTTATINFGELDNPGSRIAMAAAIQGIREDNRHGWLELAFGMLQTGSGSQFSGDQSEEGDNKVTSWGRHMQSFVVAWDLVQRANTYITTPIVIGAAATFTINQWIADMYDTIQDSQGKTIRQQAEERPQNIGSHSRASAAMLGVYFQNQKWVNHAAAHHAAWAGDNSLAAYQHLDFRAQDDWYHIGQGPPYYGIIPSGMYYDSPTNTQTASGCQPEEARRNEGCYGPNFHWDPPETDYLWEGLQGAVVAAQVFASHGYETAWEWNAKALYRAMLWNFDIPRNCDSSGQDLSDQEGLIPTQLHAPLARILNGVYQAGKGASIPATYTAMRSVIGLDWYLGV